MTINEVLSIVGMAITQETCLKLLTEMKLIEAQECATIGKDAELLRQVLFRLIMPVDLKVQLVTHDLMGVMDSDKHNIVIGRIIGTKIVVNLGDVGGNTLFYNLKALSKFFVAVSEEFKKYSSLTFDEEQIKLYYITDDCVCCS